MSLTISSLGLNRGQRGFIVGQSGSGKSVLAAQLLPASGTLFVIDPKSEFDNRMDLKIFTDARKIPFKSGNRVLFRPSPEDFSNLGMYDYVFKRIYDLGNAYTYIDEVTPFTSALVYPHYLKVLYQLGRSKNLTTLATTQRPTCVPKILFTEANKIYAFRLADSEDVRRVNYLIPEYEKPKKFYFYYLDSDHDRTKLVTLKIQ